MYYKYSTLTGKHGGARSCLSTCVIFSQPVFLVNHQCPLWNSHTWGSNHVPMFRESQISCWLSHIFLFNICLLVVSSFRIATRANPQRFRSPLCLQGKSYHQNHLDLLERTLLLCTSRCSTGDSKGWQWMDGVEWTWSTCVFVFHSVWLLFQQMIFDFGAWESFKVDERSRKKHQTMGGNHQERLRRSETGRCQPI